MYRVVADIATVRVGLAMDSPIAQEDVKDMDDDKTSGKRDKKDKDKLKQKDIQLSKGEAFEISECKTNGDGIMRLKLKDGRGWVSQHSSWDLEDVLVEALYAAEGSKSKTITHKMGLKKMRQATRGLGFMGRAQRDVEHHKSEKRKATEIRAALHVFVTKDPQADELWLSDAAGGAIGGATAPTKDAMKGPESDSTEEDAAPKLDEHALKGLAGLLEEASANELISADDIELATKLVNLAKDWVCSFLPHCLGKRDRVDYGLLSAADVLSWNSGSGAQQKLRHPVAGDCPPGTKVRLFPTILDDYDIDKYRDADGGPLSADPGSDNYIGEIVKSDDSKTPWFVRTPKDGRTWWYNTPALVVVDDGTVDAQGSEQEIFEQDRWNPKSRKLLAVPFSGKDAPSPKSEFSSPEILIGLTFLAYRYSGMRKYDLFRLFSQLKQTMKTEPGPFADRPSHQQFEKWKQSAETARAASKHTGVANLEVLSLDLFEPDDSKQMHSAHLALSFVGEAALDYMDRMVFPEVLKHQTQKMQASGMDIGSDMLFGTRLGFSGTPSDLLPYSLGSVGVQPGTDAKIVRTLTSGLYVKLPAGGVAPGWSVESVLQQIARADPPFHAMVDAGALITGFSNVDTARFLLDNLRPEFKGCAFLDSQNHTMILMRESNRVMSLADCGLQPVERFSFYDQVHSTGTDIKQCAQARCAVTLGKGMTLRDLAQGAWRMRGLTLGQTIQLIVVPEVQKQIDSTNTDTDSKQGSTPTPATGGAVALPSGSADVETRLRKVVSWLLSNSASSEQKQNLQLLGQQAMNLYRCSAFDALISSSTPELPVSKWSLLSNGADRREKRITATLNYAPTCPGACGIKMAWIGSAWPRSEDPPGDADLSDVDRENVKKERTEHYNKDDWGFDTFSCSMCYAMAQGYRWNCYPCMKDLCATCTSTAYEDTGQQLQGPFPPPRGQHPAFPKNEPLFTSRFVGESGRHLTQAQTLRAVASLHATGMSMIKQPRTSGGCKNDEGAPVAKGKDASCTHLYYCGRNLGKDAIPGSDGQCGPSNGPQCPSCKRTKQDPPAEDIQTPKTFAMPKMIAIEAPPDDSTSDTHNDKHVGSSNDEKNIGTAKVLERLWLTLRSLPSNVRVTDRFGAILCSCIAQLTVESEYTLTRSTCSELESRLLECCVGNVYVPPSLILTQKERDGWVSQCKKLSGAPSHSVALLTCNGEVWTSKGLEPFGTCGAAARMKLQCWGGLIVSLCSGDSFVSIGAAKDTTKGPVGRIQKGERVQLAPWVKNVAAQKLTVLYDPAEYEPEGTESFDTVLKPGQTGTLTEDDGTSEPWSVDIGDGQGTNHYYSVT